MGRARKNSIQARTIYTIVYEAILKAYFKAKTIASVNTQYIVTEYLGF